MSKRRRKRRSRGAGAKSPQAAPAPRSTGDASASEGTASSAPAALRPWREVVQSLRARLRAFARERFAPAVAPFVDVDPRDRERLEEDFVCQPGSSGEPHSILRKFTEHEAELPAGDREQLLRWERERGRGVFLVQDATRDRLVVWDPIEGAGLTLHLLTRLPRDRARTLETGTVATVTYAPWMARILAIDPPELFADPRAAELFEREVREGGQSWHPAPPPAPKATPRAGRS